MRRTLLVFMILILALPVGACAGRDSALLVDGVRDADNVMSTLDGPGKRYMFRPGEVLVRETDLRLAEKDLTRADAEEVDSGLAEALGIRVFRTRSPEAVPDLVRRLRSATANASANVVLSLGWHISCPSPPQPLSPDRAKILQSELTNTEVGDPEPVRVGLIDVGVADHPWLNDHVEKRPTIDEDVFQTDAHGHLRHGSGHGTFAASQIARHAPAARVVARRAVISGGFIDDLTLAEALLGLENEAIDVINLSLGGYTPDDIGLIATGEALRRLYTANEDLVVVAAAGNHNSDRPYFPAAYEAVVSVGAIDNVNERAYFSNHGWWVDAWAPGVSVEGAFPQWSQVVWPHTSGEKNFGGGFASWSGTSFAAPQVAGIIAARMSELRNYANSAFLGRQAVFEVVQDEKPTTVGPVPTLNGATGQPDSQWPETGRGSAPSLKQHGPHH